MLRRSWLLVQTCESLSIATCVRLSARRPRGGRVEACAETGILVCTTCIGTAACARVGLNRSACWDFSRLACQ